MRRRIIGGIAAAVVIVAVAIGVWHDAIVGAVVRSAVRGFGYQITFARLHAGLGAASADGVRITNAAGEPLLSADRIDLRYALRDLLPGSTHRFGLSAVDVERPQLTLIHHPDGTYNVTLPANSRPPAKPDTTPIDVRVRIRDGSVVAIDRFTRPGREQRFGARGVTVDAQFAPHTHSFYDARFAYDAGGGTYPVHGHAVFAADRGFESQHWVAAVLPIAQLVDFALPSHAIEVTSGELAGIDARVYAFVDPDGTTHTHVGVRAALQGGAIAVSGLREPIRDVHGPIAAYDDGVTTTGIDATLAGVPFRLAGGVYGLAAPQLRFALTGGGPLRELRALTANTARLPVDGDVRIAFRAIGPATLPTIAGTVSSPAVTDGALRLGAPHATIATRGSVIDVLDAGVAYGPLTVAAAGAVDISHAPALDLVATIAGDGDALPYVPQLVRGLHLEAAAHVDGPLDRPATNAILTGTGPHGDLDALVALDGAGDGVVGPVAIRRDDGASLYARVGISGARAHITAIAAASRFSLLNAPPPAAALPGIAGTTLPALAGTADLALAATVDGDQLSGARGRVALHGLRVGPVTGSLDASLGPASDGTLRAAVRGRTNLADLDGGAAEAGGAIAFEGRLRSSFDRLRPLTGDLGARGAIDVPLRLYAGGGATVAQIAGARFPGANVHGIALRDADATVALRGDEVAVRAARIGVDGGDAIAYGTLGPHGTLLAATSALPLQPLATAALPIGSGTLAAHARVTGPLSDPRAHVALLVAGANVRGTGIAGTVEADYVRHTLTITDGDAVVAGAIANATGTVRDLGGARPSVDVNARLQGAQLAELARIVTIPVRYPDGELDATLHASGALAAPHVVASLRIPNGSVNGLDFRDAGVDASGDPSGLALRGGTVTVGTTRVAFDGAIAAGSQRVSLRAPHVDLADFDDYFDTADALAGTGHVALDATANPSRISTSGDVGLARVRWHRFAIGTTTARWSTRGRAIRVDGAVQGTHGDADLGATATLPASTPLRDPQHRVAVDGSARVSSLDLAAWLPAAGVVAPVAGIVNANATFHGTFAAPQLALNGAVNDGAVAGYHLDALTLAATGDRGGAHVTSLHVAGTGLVADASGTLGFGPHDPIALELRASAPDLPALEHALQLKTPPIGGSANATLAVSGTRSAPHLAATLDAAQLSADRFVLPRLHAVASGDRSTFRLAAFEADLTAGRLLASATLPIVLLPAPGVREAPFTANLRADAVDLSSFATLLPKGTTLAGRVDGSIAASGTPGDPSIDGTFAFSDGRYASSIVRGAITGMRARLAFTRENAQLTGVHADVGGGAIDGSGAATFGDLRDLRRSLALHAKFVASNARLDVPRYITGTVNGDLTAVKAGGQRDVTIGGDVAFSRTRIPLTALIPSAPSNPNQQPAAYPVAFDLTVRAANDVRVQSGGVDIGGAGAVTVGGTLAAPTLDGEIRSTDGTISLYRTFRLQQGIVSFNPSDGVIPDVDATATTTISNPDTDILLHVTGPATNLNLDLASNPSYDKQQILGLLVNAQALGAVSGVQTTQTSGSGINATSIAGGYLSGVFTQSLLEPLGSQLGQSLGLSDLALGYDYGSGFSAGASRTLGKNLTASVHQTFGFDQRTVVGFAYALKNATAVQLSIFDPGTQSPRLGALQSFLGQDPFTPPNYTLQALQPPPGVGGVVLTYQRKYWAVRGEQ